MASHPYISGPGNIVSMIGYLRKNFPPTVTSDTVKRLNLASNNESYVINAIRFLGLIDEEGKRTARGHDALAIHDDLAFQKAFEAIVKDAYQDLFELRAEDAWTMSKDELIGYFRSVDKTSALIAARQAAVFQVFRGIAGRDALAMKDNSPKPAAKTAKTRATRSPEATKAAAASLSLPIDSGIQQQSKKDMALTVRIEINLPAEASAETYDNIFKSIKVNLLP